MPSLLQIVIQADVPVPVRQATAIFMKNFISRNWQEKDGDGAQIEFSIHEQDRTLVRNNIIESLIQSPEMLNNRNIYVHIASSIFHIIKCDFPGRWPEVVEKIRIYLQTNNYQSWTGAVMVLYQLVKHYEYKKANEREPLDEAMNILLPIIYELMVNLMQNSEQTEECVLLQKNILKVYYTLIQVSHIFNVIDFFSRCHCNFEIDYLCVCLQFCLPLDLITQDVFSKWMEICRFIIDSAVPVDITNLDEEERLELPWWKAKKWAMHICCRTFERYGSPGNEVNKDYKKFSAWYLQTFTRAILESLLKILDSYRNNVYVSPRVLTEALCYMKTA